MQGRGLSARMFDAGSPECPVEAVVPLPKILSQVMAVASPALGSHVEVQWALIGNIALISQTFRVALLAEEWSLQYRRITRDQ